MNAIKFVVILLVVMFVSCGGNDPQDSTGTGVQVSSTQPSAGRRMKLSAVTVGNGNSSLDQTPTGFFYPIGRAVFNQDCGTWLGRDMANGGCYFKGEYHLGVDMMTYSTSAQVYAIADGTVVYVSVDKTIDGSVWGIGNCALVIEHKTYDGKVFTAVYGHLRCSSIPTRNANVYAGKPIGITGDWCCGIHLHFVIHDGAFNGSNPMARSGWGKLPNSSWPSTNTFVDPIDFIQTKNAYNPSTEVQTRCQGDICWTPKTASCETSTSRYRLLSPPFARVEDASVCSELQANLTYITSAPNPEERIPEDHGWRKWWRAIRNFFGETVSAADIRDFGTINTISVLTGNVVAGNATLSIHGAGQGYSTEIADVAVVVPPDFITRRTWLETPWGTETYQYGRTETVKMKAQFENIGDGPCDPNNPKQTIPVHFYLSKGYKEDAHSDWKRVGTDEIQCANLKPGDTHTETEGIELWRDIPELGIWNIVACVDHPYDDHNNGGDHKEKHESNNCSTEAVFEVVEGTVNVPNVDLTVSGLTVLQAPVYAGDYIRLLGAWIRNTGTVNATNDIRSSYTVSCNGAPATMLTDDLTTAASLTAGASAWEEILTPVLMPNVVGTCTLTFMADYLGSQPETDETNNSTSLTVTLAPRPAPVLSITRFEDKVDCCTTNTGAAPKPRIWVYNDGNAAPGANVTVVYQVSSPVATGGLYQVIGYGTIEPRELPPKTSDEDQMDCDGCWRIPTTSAWKKQWHNFRACLRTDGGTPVPST
ncbi:MAG: hypothetical protein E6P95_03840, partial [Candidatus Moraniibacteriota bacterium]